MQLYGGMAGVFDIVDPVQEAKSGLDQFRNATLLLLVAQLGTGLLFAYGAFPAWAQPVHLVMGVGLFLTTWGLFWRTTSS